MSDQASIASGQTKPRFGQFSPVLLTVLLVLGIVTLGLGLTYAGRTTSMSPLWSVALICGAGGLLAALIPALWAQSRRDADLRALAKVYHGDVDAVLITDSRGKLEHANPSAHTMLRLQGCDRIDLALAQRLPNAAAVVARHLAQLDQDLGAQIPAREVLRLSKGGLRLALHNTGDFVIWRIEFMEARGEISGFGAGLGLPALLLSAEDEVLAINDAAIARLMARDGKKIERLADIVDDLPLKSGQTHRVHSPRGVVDMRAALAARVDGTRELFLLGPDHLPRNSTGLSEVFDALPAALLHVAGDGQVLVANRAAQRLLAIEAGGDLGPLGNLVEGLGRPVRDWVADVLAERVPNRPEMVRVRNRDDDCFVQITLGRVVAENAPAGLGGIHSWRCCMMRPN